MHSAFVPFAAPPAGRRAEATPIETERVAAPLVTPEPAAREQAAAEPDPEPEPEPIVRPSIVVQACTHEALIRSEAIRLAAIACGRALRRAAVIHPQVISAFVDEAMEAAGRATEGVVAVREEAEALGDVAITFGDAGIEADLETRAALLVRAAASG
jgi:hypothetical protein